MDKDFIKEQIENNKDLRRNLWTTVIVLTGGLAGIFFSVNSFTFNLFSIIKTGLFLFGIFIDFIFITEIVSCNKEIYKLIRLLKGS